MNDTPETDTRIKTDNGDPAAVSTENPYAPPRDFESPRDSADPMSFWRVSILILLGFCTTFCLFVLGAAIWEVATMPTNAYGPNTAMFRNSYLRAGAFAILLGAASIFAAIRIQRRQSYGILLATLAVLGILELFIV